jgi:hypothetical protein
LKGHGGAPSGSHAAWELQICWASALRDCFLPPRDFPIQPIQTIPGVQSHKFVSKTDLLALWQPKTPFVVFCHGSNTKKRPCGSACLDEFQVWQTGGARSRNHKKMGCPARPLHTDRSATGICYGSSSGPNPNIWSAFEFQQVPSGTILIYSRLNLSQYSR